MSLDPEISGGRDWLFPSPSASSSKHGRRRFFSSSNCPPPIIRRRRCVRNPTPQISDAEIVKKKKKTINLICLPQFRFQFVLVVGSLLFSIFFSVSLLVLTICLFVCLCLTTDFDYYFFVASAIAPKYTPTNPSK